MVTINIPIPHGERATLSFTTDLIAPYKYQWKKDGVFLTQGNDKSYTTPPLRPLDFKAKFSVVVYGQDKTEESPGVSIDDKVLDVPPIPNTGAGVTIIPPPINRRISAVDTRPLPHVERRHGAPDLRVGIAMPPVKPVPAPTVAPPPPPAPVVKP